MRLPYNFLTPGISRAMASLVMLLLLTPPLAAQERVENETSDNSTGPGGSDSAIEILEARVRRLEEQLNRDEGESSLSWSGYAVMALERRDFYRNTQDDDPDSRLTTDIERIILAPRYVFDENWEFFMEIELEHGGTGSAVEYEPEEFGEYETEIEHGGEIVLEQAHITRYVTPGFNWRAGHLLVPFGMVNTHHEPTQYFTVRRSAAETAVIPSVWHETGVEFFGSLGRLRYRLQWVEGLDSSGFSGPYFVRDGAAQRLEFRYADDPALVARLDWDMTLGVTLGGAVYYGNSAGNRPSQNLGVDAQVALGEVHLRLARGNWTVRTQYLRGSIDNADAVTDANRRTFNREVLGISNTAVGSLAESFFIETGYNILPALGWRGSRLDLFLRYDDWDSMADVTGSITDVPRYDRDAVTAGINYHPVSGLVFKAEAGRRSHAGSIGNEEDYAAIGAGVEF